jgi:uncharacterized protein (DUF1330 family)
MAGYVIGNIDVTNPEAFEEYRKLVPDTIAAYNGKYLVRGGAADVAEGSYSPVRIVVLEFESVDQAKKWYNSPEYIPLREMRMNASNGDLYFVEGL